MSPCIPIIGLAEMHPGATNGREVEKDYGVCVGTERSGEKIVSCWRRINSVPNNLC